MGLGGPTETYYIGEKVDGFRQPAQNRVSLALALWWPDERRVWTGTRTTRWRVSPREDPKSIAQGVGEWQGHSMFANAVHLASRRQTVNFTSLDPTATASRARRVGEF